MDGEWVKGGGDALAAMREGRRRPSLLEEYLGRDFRPNAAMREGRRRPSLDYKRMKAEVRKASRNEGGAPAPLVAANGVEYTYRVTLPQ